MKKSGFLFENVKRVYVVFVDEVSIWWLRFLKKGFRHCYILWEIDDGITWIEFNPMSNQSYINVYKFFEPADYISLLSKVKKCEVCEVLIEEARLELAPLSLFNCVEFAKRVIGLHDRFIFTPYQLYKKLKVVGKKS